MNKRGKLTGEWGSLLIGAAFLIILLISLGYLNSIEHNWEKIQISFFIISFISSILVITISRWKIKDK